MQQELQFIELAKILLEFAAVPIIAFAWMHYKMTQGHAVQIAVMKSEFVLTKENSDRQITEIKDGLSLIFKKLDEIQRNMTN